ncbi:retrovirus-related pol polyprotein from transposon TNT 1-94 [Tanacetum coccineum]
MGAGVSVRRGIIDTGGRVMSIVGVVESTDISHKVDIYGVIGEGHLASREETLKSDIHESGGEWSVSLRDDTQALLIYLMSVYETSETISAVTHMTYYLSVCKSLSIMVVLSDGGYLDGHFTGGWIEVDDVGCCFVVGSDCLEQKLSEQTEFIVQLILFIVDSGCTKHMTSCITVCAILLRNTWLLSENLLFCLKRSSGNDLLSGNRVILSLSISLQETTSSTPICLLAKASPTQAWLWHRRLSHLTSWTYVVTMAGSSIMGTKYILVIVDDYSRYTWTLFLRSKDETPEVLKDFLTMIQRNLQAPVIYLFRTDRGTEFLNKLLMHSFEKRRNRATTSTPRTYLEQNACRIDETALSLRLLERCFQLLNFLYSFGLKQSQPHAILKTDQSSSQLMRKRHITSLMTENPLSNTFTSLLYMLHNQSWLKSYKMKKKGDMCILVGYSN